MSVHEISGCRIRPYTPADRAQVYAVLCERLFPDAARLDLYWEWQLERHPHVANADSYRRVVIDDTGAVVGCLSTMPLPLLWRRERVRFIFPMHLAGRRGYGHGALRLLQETIRQSDALCTVGSGHARVQEIFDRELTPVPLVTATTVDVFPPWADRPLLRLGRRLRRRPVPPAVRLLPRLPDSLDAAVRGLQAEQELCVEHDCALVNWRYADFPEPCHTLFVYDADDGFGWLALGRYRAQATAVLFACHASAAPVTQALTAAAYNWCLEHGICWLRDYRAVTGDTLPRHPASHPAPVFQFRCSDDGLRQFLADRRDWPLAFGDIENSHYFFW